MSDDTDNEDGPAEFTDEDQENEGGEIPVETDASPDTTEGADAQKRLSKGRDRLGEEADKAVDQFDQSIVDLLSWVLDTETRARIFVYLRQHPYSTSEEIAEGTGLYPSTVRESLAELHTEEKVLRRKRESEGAGNNPYEYTAIAPSELVGGIVGQIQDELNTVFNLDDHLERGESELEPSEPVSIEVEESVSADTERDEESADTTQADESADTTQADESADDTSDESDDA